MIFVKLPILQCIESLLGIGEGLILDKAIARRHGLVGVEWYMDACVANIFGFGEWTDFGN